MAFGNKTLPKNNVEPQTDTCRCIELAENVANLVRSLGYPFEIFENVETEDKYLITLYRIPHGISDKNTERPVVLLMHGFLASPMDYLLMGPKRGLAYILADGGYDVWLGNYRGSKYASAHKELNPNLDKDYWNFSFHEIGVYDLPAMIDFITKTTGCMSLSYIGTSQGSTSMFVMLSEKPQYNNILKLVICLAPVRLISNSRSPILRNMALYPVTWKPFALLMRWFSFPTEMMTNIMIYFANNYQKKDSVVRCLLTRLLFAVFGNGSEPPTSEEYNLIVKNLLNRTSVKHFIHFSQNAMDGKFRKFDFGELENVEVYNQGTPPDYDTSKMTCPVALFYSNGDWVSTQKDVEVLKQNLPNVVVDHFINNTKFNHLDFSFAANVVNELYNNVQQVLNEYNFNKL